MRQIAVARPAESVGSQLVHRRHIARDVYELHIFVAPENGYSASRAVHGEVVPLLRVRCNDGLEPLAILDKFDGSLQAAQMLGKRKEARLGTRMALAVAQGVDAALWTARIGVPSNVISGPPDDSFNFPIVHWHAAPAYRCREAMPMPSTGR